MPPASLCDQPRWWRTQASFIAFQQIGELRLLRAVFTDLTVPPAVAREILQSVPPTPWIVERRLTQPIAPLVLRAQLGAGESEALSALSRS